MTALNVARYLTTREGPLASTWTEAVGFVNTKHGPNYPWPDFELVFIPASFLADDGYIFRKAYGLTDELWALYEPYAGRDSVMVFPVMLKSRSRGHVRISSWIADKPPILEPNYFGDE